MPVSERRVCRVLGQHRSTQRKTPRGADDEAALSAAMNEVRDLALAKGVTLAPDIVAATLAFVANFPADATSSLQRDVMLGRASEYDFLPGAVLRLGRELGVSTPCFDQIHRLASAANDALEVH